jgi:hypothetical protein
MINSNLINFTNGSGGNSSTCVTFFFVDQYYNWMIGKHTFTDRPLGNLDIGDNNSTYSIYQRGASSINWLAGNTIIGGSGTPPSSNGYTLQLFGGLTLGQITLPVTPVNGALETDGIHLYWTDFTNVRHIII